MTPQPTDRADDPRLQAALLELDAPARMGFIWRSMLHHVALRVVAWTAPPEDVYLSAAIRRR